VKLLSITLKGKARNKKLKNAERENPKSQKERLK
jgi:hypothetical protein